jgi:MraZ protein
VVNFVLLQHKRFYPTEFDREMLQFLGNMEAKADAKGRIFIPALFRKRLQSEGEEFLVLRKDIFQDCLVLYPGSVWEKEIGLIRSRLNKWDREQQQIFRQFLLDAERIEMDANGRILIPKRYLQMVSIEADVRFLGVDETIEIWAKEKLEQPLVDPDEFSAALQQLMTSYP